MVWFANHISALGIYLPVALAGSLCPFSIFSAGGTEAVYHILSISMAISHLSIYWTGLGLGTSNQLAQMALSGALASCIVSKVTLLESVNAVSL